MSVCYIGTNERGSDFEHRHGTCLFVFIRFKRKTHTEVHINLSICKFLNLCHWTLFMVVNDSTSISRKIPGKPQRLDLISCWCHIFHSIWFQFFFCSRINFSSRYVQDHAPKINNLFEVHCSQFWLKLVDMKFIAINRCVLHIVFQIFYVGGRWSCEEDQCGAWWHWADLQPGFQHSVWSVELFRALKPNCTHLSYWVTVALTKPCTYLIKLTPLPKDGCKYQMGANVKNGAGR